MLKNRLIHTSLLALSFCASPVMASDFQDADGVKPAMTLAISQADYEKLVQENKCFRLEILDQKKARASLLGEKVALMEQLKTAYGYVIQLDDANRALIDHNAQITGDLQQAVAEIAVLKQQLTSSLARCTALTRENEVLQKTAFMYWGVGGYYIRLVLLWMNKPVEENAIAAAEPVKMLLSSRKKVRKPRKGSGENVGPSSTPKKESASRKTPILQEKDALGLFMDVLNVVNLDGANTRH